MITILNGHPEASQGYICGVTLKIGQFATISGFDTDGDTPKVQIPATGLAAGTVFPILRYPKDNEEMQLMHEGTYTAVSGTRVIGVRGFDIVIEDDGVYDEVGAAAFSGIVVGDPMRLNASGYLTPADADTHPVIARIEKLDTTAKIVTYRLVQA